MSRKPSITICPDSVAVTVEFSPQAEQRDARTAIGAARRAEQRRQELVDLAELGHVVSARVWWKVDAARIRIEALISSANISAMVESMVASLIASRFSGTLSPNRRVCTMPECR